MTGAGLRCQIKFSTRPTPDATLRTLWAIERDCPSTAHALRWAATVLERTKPELVQAVSRVQIVILEHEPAGAVAPAMWGEG